MLDTPKKTTRLTTFHDLAAGDALGATGTLTPAERHAVILGALAALPLDDDAARCAFERLRSDGCAFALAEDVLTQMAAYLGFPRAEAALDRLCAVYGQAADDASGDGLDDEQRYARGAAVYGELNPDALPTIRIAFGDIAPVLIDRTFRAFGDVYGTSRLPLTTRQLATVGALSALGGVGPQLRFHFGAAIRVGVSREQLVEAVTWVQVLAGMPAAYNALIELKAVLTDGADAPPAYR